MFSSYVNAYPFIRMPSYHHNYYLNVIGCCPPYIALIPYISSNRSNSLMINAIADFMLRLSSPTKFIYSSFSAVTTGNDNITMNRQWKIKM